MITTRVSAAYMYNVHIRVDRNISIYDKFEVDNIIKGDYKQENYGDEWNPLLLKQDETLKKKAGVLLYATIWRRSHAVLDIKTTRVG
jgi:hypothetical protein